MTIFEVLRQDHEKQRLLLKILCETHGDTPARREYFEELKQALQEHATAEERHFYMPLMKHDGAVDLSRHGIAEHHEIDELIAKLDSTEWSSPVWLKTLKQLREQVEHHLNDEEQGFFQVAGKILSAKQKNELAQSYRNEMTSLA